MTELDKYKADNAMLRSMLKDLLFSSPAEIDCHNMHHPRKYQHSSEETCPVVSLYLDAREAATQALARTQADSYAELMRLKATCQSHYESAMKNGHALVIAEQQLTAAQARIAELEAELKQYRDAEVVGCYDDQCKEFSEVDRVGWKHLIVKP